ncbi:MAG: 1-acyl-sn-glycerol-3-phosphate acyltransferase [Gammaproteobacteria bacterium]|nr:1-acyl-sn-glycerol-3-phosphate acyltransferase [Gammaproteobacteria bacterium]
MRFIRSLIFSMFMVGATLITALLLVLALPTPFSLRSAIARTYAVAVVGALRLLCGIGYQLRGQENIPSGAAIIYSKHQSTWETYALQVFLPAQVWVLKRELMWLPFFGWGMAALKPIAIDRRAGRRAIDSIVSQGIKRLQAGIWVTIFPEGTRIAPGERKRWGLGGAILAERSGYPVVPVAHNAGEFWGKHQFVKKPGTIQVVIGPPVETQGRKAADISREVEAWMTETMAEISEYERGETEEQSGEKTKPTT